MVDNPSAILSGNIALGYESYWDDSRAVTVTAMADGSVQTNRQHAPIRRMALDSANLTLAQVKVLEEFRAARSGRLNSFLFEDPLHYQLTDHTILTAVGGEATVQVREVFGEFDWTIRHIKSGSLVVKINGLETSEYTESAGLITLTGSPNTLVASDVVSVTCEFYTPVRFESAASISRSNLTYGTVQDLDLREAVGE